MELFSNTFQSLENALNYSNVKQKVISQNIANSDTPNYKAKEVNKTQSFKAELESSLESYRTDERHFTFRSEGSPASQIVMQKNVRYNNNGNSVDVDKEMTELAAIQIYYNAVTDRLSGKFQSLQNVIRGGK
ncbi:flagellar basal body rod protein FlgB [Bacillus sp. ISL-4]|uniref:flagellar basal body rod protein FlgB n=1 Tax=Bacillus sp. ISL-4 TaxID=2819125 RepID=UPI001BECC545|nr:flagellar basal body rod protein FlgB [Bacillus sp. ISL-4]MBT2665815.1 flagellar basal body rod protein FlgB [Bacillus sp. ISL-4]MBT2669852.1 flagellar basal body rod protein FlgB [Streptomyces sp. ISL-14]